MCISVSDASRILSFASLILVSATLSLAQPVRYQVSREAASSAGSPVVIVLRDLKGGVEAAVAPSQGGELTSLRVRHRQQWVELIYRAREYGPASGFRGKAPLLWPAVGGQYPVGTKPRGSCVDGEYTVAGRTYTMPCHGFAKTLEWEAVSESADERGARVTVQLQDSPVTRSAYPFAFQLLATYTLTSARLTVSYRVSADTSNSHPMNFSIGNHIAFRVPFLPGTDPGEMLFESPSTRELLRSTIGVLSGEQRDRSFAKPHRLDEFAATTALPLAGYASDVFARLSDPQGVAIHISHKTSFRPAEPLVQFNIFGGPKQGYFSPEPWVGVQNSLNTGQGVITLMPGREWTWTVAITPEFKNGR